MKVTTLSIGFLLRLIIVVADDPVLNPEAVTDSNGNTADSNSDITWASIPSFVSSYQSSGITYDSKGLEPLYNFAKAFINGAVFSGGIPWDVMDKAIDGTLMSDITSNYADYLKQFAGYGACVVIGFLFMFIFTVVGCCLCCCRTCCGNCGGKMQQSSEDARAHCKRRTFGIILLVLISFNSAGMICVYVSNDQFTAAISNVDDAVTKNLDDISTFVDGTIQQVQYIASNNFNFTQQVIIRDLDSIGYLVGIPLRTVLTSESGLDTAINSALDLEQRVSTIGSALTTVNDTLSDLLSKASVLESSLTTLKNDIDSSTAGCTGPNCPDTTNMAVGFDTSQFPDISDPVNKINQVQSDNLTKVIIEAQQEFNDIPWTVHNETQSIVGSIKDMVANFSGKIDPLISEMTSLQDTLTNGTIGDLKTTTRDFVDLATTYDKYRWYGGIGLTSIVLLVIVLEVLGLLFAVVGHDSDKSPMDRGCMGTTGGNMFMAAAGFIFIFSWLLMLLTTLVFALGSPMESFVCKPFTASDLSDLERLVDDKIYKFMYPDDEEGTLVGKLLFPDKNVSLPLTTLLRECQAGKAAYSALKLNNFFDISSFTNFSSEIDINSQTGDISSNVDLSNFNLLTPDLLSSFDELKQSTDVNFTKFREQLDNAASNQNFSLLASQLRAYGDTTPGGAFQTNMYALATRAENIENVEVANVTEAMNQLSSDLDTLESAVNGTTEAVDAVIDALNITEQYFRNNASAAVASEATNYANRLIRVVESYINDSVDALENEIGGCQPIWNFYNSIVVISFCKYTIDTLNGFWFALGWCIFFFVPSVIFAVKLAKHYRRMSFNDEYDDLSNNEYQMSLKKESSFNSDSDGEMPRRKSKKLLKANKGSKKNSFLDDKPPPLRYTGVSKLFMTVHPSVQEDDFFQQRSVSKKADYIHGTSYSYFPERGEFRLAKNNKVGHLDETEISTKPPPPYTEDW